MDEDYNSLIASLKEHVRLSQQQAVLAVNTRLLFLYWEIGHFINHQKQKLGWGASVIKQISRDLIAEFPETKGFSVRNLNYMAQFAENYTPSNLQTVVAQIENTANTKKTRSLEKVQTVPAQIENAANTKEISEIEKMQPVVTQIENAANNQEISEIEKVQTVSAQIEVDTANHHEIIETEKMQPVVAQIENEANDQEMNTLEKVQTLSAQIEVDTISHHAIIETEKVQTLPAQIESPIDWIDFINTPIAKVSWSHHITLLDKTKNQDEYNYYVNRIIAEGWSIRVLANKIEQRLFESQGSLPNNFDNTLPNPQSELAKQTLKDHYIFDFLSLGEEALERDVENALLKQVTQFLLEMGKGFAFLGQQYHLEVGGQDYYMDLLFFHMQLNSYFIIELKIDDFKPEYAGKLNFYLNAADDLLKTDNHNPTIGLLLCKSANKVVAEYSLKNNSKPIGIATYQLLPKEERFIELLSRNN